MTLLNFAGPEQCLSGVNKFRVAESALRMQQLPQRTRHGCLYIYVYISKLLTRFQFESWTAFCGLAEFQLRRLHHP